MVGERNCSSSWERRRVRSFSPGGGATGLWREGKGIFADGKGRFAGRECGAGLFQQLGPQEGQELFLPTGDLDLGHGEESSGLCLSEVFEVAEGQELSVLFVQPL